MSLEVSNEILRDWLNSVAEVGLRHLEGLAQGPAVGAIGKAGIDIAHALSLPITETPHTGGMSQLAEHVERAAQASLNTAGPGYLAYIPAGGLPSAGLADLLSNWLNRYTGVSPAAPALCRLEADTLAWLATQFGYGERARGIFTSGGSLANFSAVVTARHAKLDDSGDYRRAKVYTSRQAHHSVAKSVVLAGIPARNVVTIATDARLRLDPAALRARLEQDSAAGDQPFLLVTAAGSTNTGAVDPFAALQEVCRDFDLWHHVDGAYGGTFVLCEAGRTALAGIELADSITFDPHKGLFLPYGTGCLLVADGAALRAAHQAHAEYLQDFDRLERAGEPPSPADYGPELSRDYRGLRVWLPLQLHGAAAFRDALAEKLQLAQLLAEGIKHHIAAGVPLELVDPPQLSVVAFRLQRREHEPVTEWNQRNAALCEDINGKARVYLSSTLLPTPNGDAFTLRACVLSFRTHKAHIETALEDIADAALRY